LGFFLFLLFFFFLGPVNASAYHLAGFEEVEIKKKSLKDSAAAEKTNAHLNCSIRRECCHVPVKVSHGMLIKTARFCLLNQQWHLISAVAV